MKNIWQRVGITAFWVSWPLLYVYLRQSKRTRLLVVSGDKVLVLKNWLGAGKWSLPGGGLHWGEDPKKGAIRELREETGITVTVEQLKPLSQGVASDHGLRHKYTAYLVELTEPLPPKPQRGEVLSVTWLNWQELLATKTTESVEQLARKWFH